MQNKKQISQIRRTIGGTMLPNRQTILRIISIVTIVAILFLGKLFSSICNYTSYTMY